ncbi:MAG: SDR family NAD(P)-dependent oxidoreductase [Sphingobacteriaceae bacterium]
MDKKISIIGCGWLGLPLGKRLLTKGWEVKGSTTQSAKLEVISKAGIVPFLVRLNESGSSFDSSFLDTQVLFVNVPPGGKEKKPELLLSRMTFLIQQIRMSSVSQVVFISSTSVYHDKHFIFSNTDEINTASTLYQAENLFKAESGFNTTIIRFGGLIGPGRYPGRFLSGKRDLPNGSSPINLVHLDDCIGIVETLLEKQIYGGTYHVSTPSHPTRAAFYKLAAIKANLPGPHFKNDLQIGKTIDPAAIIEALNYEFIHPDLLEWLRGFNPDKDEYAL